MSQPSQRPDPLGPTGLAGTVRRNTFLLAASMALNWTIIQLVAALAVVTYVFLTHDPALSGLAFAAYLLTYATGGLVIGRAMDNWGRRRGLQLGFLIAAAGAAIVFGGVSGNSLPVFMVGLLAVGLGQGGANLARAAGADMYPAERRGWGITLVLVGAAFGAIGSPLLFAPLLAGVRANDPQALAAPWPIAVVVLLGAALLLLAIRIDPRDIAERLRTQGPGGAAGADAIPQPVRPPPARPLRELLALPMVPLALLAALVAQAVMTATMALASLVLVDHGHDLGSVSITLSAHFLGMFGLVLVVGKVVDRIGRFRSVVVGLLVMAGGVLALLPGPELLNFVPGMFAIGVGWNVAFVASSAILADAARPSERARLLGFSDFVAILASAALSVGAGFVVGTVGLAALVVAGVLLAVVPALLIGANRARLEGSAAG